MKHIHFIGIGGIGMSALAKLCLAVGDKVSGSDTRPNNLTEELSRRGALVFEGHDASNLPDDVEIIVTTNCIKEDNPEIIRAKATGREIITRSDLLREVMARYKTSIGVTGTHGKTTTSALISFILEECGYDPTVIVGGEIDHFGSNVKVGGGNIVVAEVDESDGIFATFNTTHAVITNMEREHMEHYNTYENMRQAYLGFIAGVSAEGVIFYNGDDGALSSCVRTGKARKVSFGYGKGNVYQHGIVEHKKNIKFHLLKEGKNIGTIESSLIGMHNAANLTAAVSVCVELGCDMSKIKEAVSSFRTVKRRFYKMGACRGIEIFEDYAHHPTELAAITKAAKDYAHGGRLISVFQPHRFSRTDDLADDFAACFNGADILILTDVYSADEIKRDGKGIEYIYDKVDKNIFDNVMLINKNKIAGYLSSVVKQGDIVLILGAGDIREIAEPLLAELRKKSKPAYGPCAPKRAKLIRLLTDLAESNGGKVLFDEPVADKSSMRIGGRVFAWYEPRCVKELAELRRILSEEGVRGKVAGALSNILFGDEYCDMVLINLSGEDFAKKIIKYDRLEAGAGAKLSETVGICVKEGLAGMEGLVGIPGTVGGALFMNASYRSEMSENLSEVKVVDGVGKIKILTRDQLYFDYRRSNFGEDDIIVEAKFNLRKISSLELREKIKEYFKKKIRTQPLGERTLGCVFKNPGEGVYAGKLLEDAGLKGVSCGDAEFSEKHANFIVNRGKAKAADVLALMELAKARVREKFGVELESEIEVV